MKVCLIAMAALLPLGAQDVPQSNSLDAVLLRRLKDPKWSKALDRLEAEARKAEALAKKLETAAAKARALEAKAMAAKTANPSDPALSAEWETANFQAQTAQTKAGNARNTALQSRDRVTMATMSAKLASEAEARAEASRAQLKANEQLKPEDRVPVAPSMVAQEEERAATTRAAVEQYTGPEGSESLPANHRLFSGLESAGVTIHTYFGTRWSNLYRDPQANDTYFRPKGFFALEHEQYFWLKAFPRLLSKWGGGAMIQGSKESDYQNTQTTAGFKKAVNATDAASAHAYFWLGGFITDTTSLGAYLQHQFSNYTFRPSDDPSAPKTFGFTDVIRSQRRLGLMLQQHDPAWRGSLLEYSICQDPLFVDGRNRQFLRGRAMYNFNALESLGFYLEGSINRGRRSDRDRDDATITLGFRLDLRVWSSPD
ncbi:MAG TPA: hypothetical protein VJ505_03015 [Holophagaceae bacterium]|nr:hypothetical protein [Holophagaceae bacterium]